MDRSDDPAARDVLIGAYVEALQQAYHDLRRRWRKGVRPPCGDDGGRWRRLAEVLAADGTDPYAYVQWVFDLLVEGHADVYANQVTSLAMAGEFIQYRPEQKARLRRLVALQADNLQQRLDRGDRIEDVLGDDLEQMSAVFRCAAASSQGLSELSGRFREQARRQVMFEPFYRELLGKWLPQEVMGG
jgi:hypothetical protein